MIVGDYNRCSHTCIVWVLLLYCVCAVWCGWAGLEQKDEVATCELQKRIRAEQRRVSGREKALWSCAVENGLQRCTEWRHRAQSGWASVMRMKSGRWCQRDAHSAVLLLPLLELLRRECRRGMKDKGNGNIIKRESKRERKNKRKNEVREKGEKVNAWDENENGTEVTRKEFKNNKRKSTYSGEYMAAFYNFFIECIYMKLSLVESEEQRKDKIKRIRRKKK